MNINDLTHKQLINKIINQANSLNKKIKAFKNNGITEHSELIHNLFDKDQVKFNKSGSITKSKKFYDNQEDIWLKKTLSTLIKLNNHTYETQTFYTLACNDCKRRNNVRRNLFRVMRRGPNMVA